MALTRPILYSLAAFDANDDQVFTFNVVGGDQVVRNQLIIINQSTGDIVYNNIQTTYAFTHTVSGGALTNGVYYSATITTYNSSNESSIASAPIQFYCYTTPTFKIINIPTSTIIDVNSYTFQLSYYQSESEKLSSYAFILYDSNKTQISTSGTIYVGTSSSPFEYSFGGLENGTIYYVEGTGVTAGGTILSTGLNYFYIQYETPSTYNVIELTNHCQGGYVTIKSNLLDIRGDSNPDPPVYIDDDTAVDLTEDGSYVTWSSGFTLSNDFTASLWGRDFTIGETLIVFDDDNGNTITVNYQLEDGYNVYAEAVVVSGSVSYYIYSDSLAKPTENDTTQIWLRRIGNLYTIQLAILDRNIDDTIAGVAVAGVSIVGYTTT